MLACLPFLPPPPVRSSQLFPLSSLSLPQQGSSTPSIPIHQCKSLTCVPQQGRRSVLGSNNSPPCQNIHPTMPLISLPACSVLPHPGAVVRWFLIGQQPRHQKGTYGGKNCNFPSTRRLEFNYQPTGSSAMLKSTVFALMKFL